MSKFTFETTCPLCKKGIKVNSEVPYVSSPSVRSNIEPVGNILVYRISSEEIKDFIIQKARQYVPDVRVMIIPRYCEKKKRNDNDMHRSYASFRIAFSENVIEKNDQDLGWYGAIGDNGTNVKLQEGIMKNLINKYQYSRKKVESWLKDYKILEELEESFGMTEAYINDIYAYTVPRRIKTENKETWIIFAAAAESIIADMLTDKTTNMLPGTIRIKDAYPMSKDIVEFEVYIHPNQMEVKENPHVRQILLGEEKPKK